ncbi:hypothetical protein GA0070624_0078 [Micromonospora rhizosphaerae]|uniref:Uncharacterized protein n=1 Tax=Micromonospora rhizosphaerae TaxID=568872 RepID=A0A1C6R8A0_9ACTN|nr:hypothetical protein [Micromonospora rhizosphaerae]SCL13297.1 hypothetical protein GA0070624_0078 [Micromonospora rhizosphaerae]
MAFRTWGRLLLTALGVSVLAGAGQLGIAYGFGIVRLNDVFTDGSVNHWPAQLVWVGWFAAVAAVAGAVLTERLARRIGFPGGPGEPLAVAGAAALGATVVAPLCMQPARSAELPTADPVWAVGICAILGAVVGAAAALAVLLKPPLGWNIAMTGGLVWLLALVSEAPSLASTGPLPTVRLGVLEPSWLDAAAAQRLTMLILPATALLAGVAVGALARWRGETPVIGGAAGAAGPVLVAFAYLTAGPGDPVDRYQLAPYYGALMAVAAGALGSTAAAVLRRRPAAAAVTDAIEPTDILQPLPVGPAPTPTTAAARDALTTVDRASNASSVIDDRSFADDPVPGVPAPASTTDDHARGSGDRASRAKHAVSKDEQRADTAGDATASGAALSGPTVSAPALSNATVNTPTVSSPTVNGPMTSGGDEERSASAVGADVADPLSEWDAEDATGSLLAPTGLPTARRISAIDVLAAGRPLATPGSGTPPATPPPGSGTPPETDEPVSRSGTVTGDSRTKPPASVTTPGTGAPAAKSTAPAPAASSPGSPTGLPESGPASPRPVPASPPVRAKRARKSRTADASAPAGPATEPAPAPADTAPEPGGRHTVPESRIAPGADPVDAPPPAAHPDASGSPGGPLNRPAGRGHPTRPRAPEVEDEADRRGEVRPAWPIAPAPARPTAPRRGATPDVTADGAGSGTPAERRPRPRHRALPDLGRSPNWDSFGNAAGPDAPVPPAASRVAGAPAGQRIAAHEGDDAAETTDPSRSTAGASADGDTGESRQRRGLFRRNRAKGGAESTTGAREPEPAHDEEYLDWVTGLGRPAADADSEDKRSLRTGRHHRD